MKLQTSYRPDIDGLRAVAVLSVILFHIDKDLLPGGFVGVDIFFVISGFLISSKIFSDIDLSIFSFAEFYKRRIKRIFPAMFVVLVITTLLAQFLMRPTDAELTAESALWSVISLANVYFWLYQDTGYFAQASAEVPLLHLWSLGVEEQFYLLWPLLCFLGYRKGRRSNFILGVVSICIASFVLAEYLFFSLPSFTYYMIPTRAGELLIGAIVAFVTYKYTTFQLSINKATALGILGVILILSSLIYLNESLTFPGFLALPPTMGAALLIYVGHFGINHSNKWLTGQLMIKVGLISYSLYLWHWPLLAFIRYAQIEITFLVGFLAFLLMFVLAILTYRYVEQPTRRLRLSAGKVLSYFFVVPTVVTTLCIIVLMKIDGYGLKWFDEGYKESLKSVAYNQRAAYSLPFICQKNKVEPSDLQSSNCIVPEDSTNETTVLLWGDSNAAHYAGLIEEFALKHGFEFRSLAIGSCPPLLKATSKYVSAKVRSDCESSLANIVHALEPYDTIIFGASYTSYQLKHANFLDDFKYTVKQLVADNKHVIILGKIPIITSFNRECEQKALSLQFMDCREEELMNQEVVAINQNLKSFSDSHNHVDYFGIDNYICENGYCSAYDDNSVPVYFDSSHLSYEGSRKIGQTIIRNEGVPFPFNSIGQNEKHIFSE